MTNAEVIIFRNEETGRIAVFDNEESLKEYFMKYIEDYMDFSSEICMTPEINEDYNIWRTLINPTYKK